MNSPSANHKPSPSQQENVPSRSTPSASLPPAILPPASPPPAILPPVILPPAILLLAILLLAAGLRFYRLDWTEYKLDEANLSRLALDMAQGRGIALQGIGSSVGIPNGPLAVWLLAIPYFFSRSPIVATGFVAALNVLAVAMTYALARRMFGIRAGWIAALLFAVAPWAVLNSRKLWAQDLLPPFVVAYLWTAFLAFVTKKPWAFAAHVAALSACIQLHYSALTFVPLTALWIILFWWKRWPWKAIIVAAIVGLASIAPFAYQIAREARRDPSAYWTAMAGTAPGRSLRVDADALHFAWLMTTGTELHSLAGPAWFRDFLASTLDLSPLFYLEGALAVAGCLLALYRMSNIERRTLAPTRSAGVSNVEGRKTKDERRKTWDEGRKESKAGFIVATAFLFPVLLFTPRAAPVYPHYFILTFPCQFILVGMLVGQDAILSYASRSVRIALTWLSGALVIAIAAGQVYAYLSILNYVAGRATPGGYGAPVGLTLRAIQSAEQMAREPNGSILVMADGDNEKADEVASIWDVLADPAFALRVVDRRQATVYPTRPAAIVHAPGAPGRSGGLYIPLRPGEDGYNVTKWAGCHAPATKGLLLKGPDRWANGVQLLAAQPFGDLRPGNKFRWQLTWRVNSPASPGVDYHWFNHLVDAQGKRLGQMDGVGFPSRSWRAGDTAITWFDVPIAPDAAPGAYKMRVGMYTFPDIKTVPVVDAANNPVGEYVEVGPIEIK